MRTHVWIAVLVVVLSGASHTVAPDDHPLVSRYEGSTVASKKALAPVASNAEPAARAKNRRVELVAR